MVVKIASVEFALTVGQISDDSVWWEEGSFSSLQKGKSVEWWKSTQVWSGLMGDFFDLDTEGGGDGFDFSVSVVGSSLGTVV